MKKPPEVSLGWLPCHGSLNYRPMRRKPSLRAER